jgi:hypothetical protein
VNVWFIKKIIIKGRIAPMAEQRFEEPIVLVRVQLRPHGNIKQKQWNSKGNGEN